MSSLRFIDSQFFSGAMNMAIDEMLSEKLAQQCRQPYLRFYKWQPATLSFGYNQKIERLADIEAVHAAGLGIVRRMSGGKMVFHNDEHTFCVGFPAEFIESRIGKGKTFLDMFTLAVSPLVEGLAKMGIPARFADSREMRHSSNGTHCYATAAGHSIYAGKRKLIGAAGVFRNSSLLIHGSIPITAGFPPENCFIGSHKISHDVDMSALRDFCDTAEIEKLPGIMAEAFSASLDLKIERQPLRNFELLEAQNLADRKYSDLYWHTSDLRVKIQS
ncbi:MAG: hypothetical protein CVV42_04055 [Candidatus Riflebacteria bacterium HGW-Riflebacteria-2]|jgi:lipoate-protein ligase A|nr:MAG: hypothetical protein CVV42_04055 [Candidatus Riflebacteria bacterium HGW-Riflebacteria-2]